MFKILLLAIMFLPTSFHTLQFTTASGTNVPMNSYSGKKVLLVNIATGSEYAGQLALLQQLQQQYTDSLVVLAFPSNSFGHEARADSAIQTFCTGTYSTSFTIARKNPVTGQDIQPVFNWLTKASENGEIEGAVQGDFQKFLISSSGEIIGIYAPKVSPVDTSITNAVMRFF